MLLERQGLEERVLVNLAYGVPFAQSIETRSLAPSSVVSCGFRGASCWHRAVPAMLDSLGLVPADRPFNHPHDTSRQAGHVRRSQLFAEGNGHPEPPAPNDVFYTAVAPARGLEHIQWLGSNQLTVWLRRILVHPRRPAGTP